MDDKLIIGIWETREVTIDGVPLRIEASQQVHNHSDTFCWGYGGSGPAQLALAILMLYLPSDQAALRHQDFKWKVISGLPQKDFQIPVSSVTDWIARMPNA